MLNKHLYIKDNVKKTLASSKPVVALESTIISHGMPYPQNVETALELEKIIKKHGALPATIAILGGQLKIGLTRQEIDFLGRKGPDVVKVSRRDLPIVLTRKQDGATTVAATMIIADMAGIKVFATGGIGGVHRGAQKTFDISADLQELARTNITVVCAGAKSVLDLGLTLEYLETHGVPVLGYKTSELPAFYTRKSGFNVNYKVDSVKELADIIRIKTEIGLTGGIVVANPIPKAYQMDRKLIDKAIEQALTKAKEKGIKGKACTPFLLEEIKNLTGGKSLKANIQLVFNNGKLAARLAKQLNC